MCLKLLIMFGSESICVFLYCCLFYDNVHWGCPLESISLESIFNFFLGECCSFNIFAFVSDLKFFFFLNLSGGR